MNKENIAILTQTALAQIKSAKTDAEIYSLKIKLLGRKGEINKLYDELKSTPDKDKPLFGKLINEIRNKITSALDEATTNTNKSEKKEFFDPTLPGRKIDFGKLHPLTTIMNEVRGIFSKLGFQESTGQEIETEYYNFEALNTPADHPARDMQSTFYINCNPDITPVENRTGILPVNNCDLLLRTHTSAVQIRAMEKIKPPLSIIAIGKCYRSDPPDATHSPVFHQVEGLMIDENITFKNLKAILELFFKELFGNDIKIRLTPSYFPFTEPSAEVSVACIMCKGKGCAICKKTGWLELFGAGMVDPNVFKAVGIDSEKWTGFAFGGGIERIAMIKYGIDDIRLFYENDINFLNQF
ncbi:MAG: phenylalanine--tRNA ligase subunit alpha [Candidatus Firestonebacteria bacterium]